MTTPREKEGNKRRAIRHFSSHSRTSLSRLISRCLTKFLQQHLSSKIVIISKQHNLMSQTRSNHPLNRMKIVGNSAMKIQGTTTLNKLFGAYTRPVSGPTGSCSVHPAPRRCTEDSVRTFETWCRRSGKAQSTGCSQSLLCASQRQGSQSRTHSKKATNRNSNNVLDKNIRWRDRQTDMLICGENVKMQGW